MAKPGGLALLLGSKDSGAESDDDADESMASDFESAAIDAFPDMEGQPERIAALKQAIMACMDTDYSS